jgi:uncharacterized protein YndB with AHSA1/START domain
MSSCKEQALIEAPAEVVWDLVSDVRNHPRWWPRVIEVECEGIEQGCTYRRVLKGPLRTDDTTVLIERLDDCREIVIRCLDTGSYSRIVLTAAQGNTFIEAEAGMEPKRWVDRVVDPLGGKRYFRGWLRQTLEALRREAAARTHSATPSDRQP